MSNGPVTWTAPRKMSGLVSTTHGQVDEPEMNQRDTVGPLIQSRICRSKITNWSRTIKRVLRILQKVDVTDMSG